MMMIEEYAGEKVIHKAYGVGKIYWHNYIDIFTVDYETIGEKPYSFPQAFEDGTLRFVDENVQKKIEHKISLKNNPKYRSIIGEIRHLIKENNFHITENKYKLFWNCYQKILIEEGYPYTICPYIGEVIKQFGAVNSSTAMSNYDLSVEVFSDEDYMTVYIYVCNDPLFFNTYLYNKKDEIKKYLGFPVEWSLIGEKNKYTKRLLSKIKFDFNKVSINNYEDAIRKTIPYVKKYIDMIKTFVPLEYSDKFFG